MKLFGTSFMTHKEGKKNISTLKTKILGPVDVF